MERIRPPIQGTTLRTQSPLFSSTGVLESSIPFPSETFSKSGICLAVSAIITLGNSKTYHISQKKILKRRIWFINDFKDPVGLRASKRRSLCIQKSTAICNWIYQSTTFYKPRGSFSQILLLQLDSIGSSITMSYRSYIVKIT